MDLQKEREAFEKECRLLRYKGNMAMSNLGNFYNNEQTNWMWQMWLSSKAQAIPEGFVVVPKEPTRQIYRTFYDAFNSANAGNTAQCFKVAYKAMIEAQEQAND